MATKRSIAVLAACCVALTACSSDFKGVYDLPLPGGADIGDHPYRVTVQFADVLDLVPQAAVKVGDVPVGRVEKIQLGEDGWTAETVLALNGDVHLPANAIARLRQSSLLGEKFIELAPSAARAEGRLGDGGVIPVASTNRNPEFEEVFGALSLLLNGGGIGQLQTINRELSKVMDGNEEEIRSFLSTVEQLVSNLDSHRSEITSALDGLNQLSATLANRKKQVEGALTDLTPGLQSLSDQRTQLVSMLQALDRLSGVGVDVIKKSKADLVADLTALAPILKRLADAGENLPKSLEILPTFPFTDAVRDGIKGDYLNVYASMIPAPGVELPPPGEGVPPDLPTLPLPSSGGS
ncbi:ABC transporter substrate-binding protein [Amycolatopsis sp. WAC 01376]|uniref:MCE family protein n=1 Tax=Amycolatopsis sp. WAC 01376 TaxID=2203195 RepID=UPI000F7AA11E|nr:MCE family protein [Amycolatopsis sp. WAC 01376]RSM63308.1 ABC transporter substrate-binding protein [Amycolatopsis sp. WAC 01376]